MSRRRTSPDFTYREDGMFAQILPESARSVRIWNETIGPQTGGTGKILVSHLAAVSEQLRCAGYTLDAAPPVTASDLDLLAALGCEP